jgi:hypothetical protein
VPKNGLVKIEHAHCQGAKAAAGALLPRIALDAGPPFDRDAISARPASADHNSG